MLWKIGEVSFFIYNCGYPQGIPENGGKSYESGNYTVYYRQHIRRLVFNRCRAGILDAGGICNGGGWFYQGKELRKHYYEESDGFLYWNSNVYSDRIFPAAWGGYARTHR